MRRQRCPLRTSGFPARLDLLCSDRRRRGQPRRLWRFHGFRRLYVCDGRAFLFPRRLRPRRGRGCRRSRRSFEKWARLRFVQRQRSDPLVRELREPAIVSELLLVGQESRLRADALDRLPIKDFFVRFVGCGGFERRPEIDASPERRILPRHLLLARGFDHVVPHVRQQGPDFEAGRLDVFQERAGERAVPAGPVPGDVIRLRREGDERAVPAVAGRARPPLVMERVPIARALAKGLSRHASRKIRFARRSVSISSITAERSSMRSRTSVPTFDLDVGG